MLSANCCGRRVTVSRSPIRIDAATSSITTAVCIPPSSMAVRRCVQIEFAKPQSDDDRGQHGKPRGFRSRHETRKDAAKNDDRKRNVGIASTKDGAVASSENLLRNRKIVALGEPPRDGHKAEPSEIHRV